MNAPNLQREVARLLGDARDAGVEALPRPAFLYYGSKFRLARYYPPPRPGDTVVEPFAGSAGYSMRHYRHPVVLVDSYPVVVAVWQYLIRAKPADILRLPLIRADETVDDLRRVKRGRYVALSEVERWLIGFWLNTACTNPVKSLSQWGRVKTFGVGGYARNGKADVDYDANGALPAWAKRGQDDQFWTAGTRAHVARVAGAIKHWRAYEGDYESAQRYVPLRSTRGVTWFIDPPYSSAAGAHYVQHGRGTGGKAALDYHTLGAFCRARAKVDGLGHGAQVIACESARRTLDWLPFRPLVVSRSANVRAEKTRMTNHEAVWVSS